MTHRPVPVATPAYSDRPSPEIAPNAPRWFHDALARPRRVREVEVGGTPVRYLAWGEPGGPAVVLVHGGAAHALWWAPLAARLDPSAYVVAMDMSGHGISGRRPVYTVDQWGDEILAVAEDASSHEPVTVIGHSLGGIVLANLTVRCGDRLGRAVFLDAPVWSRAPAPEGALAPVANRPPRTYRTAEEALGRFRLVPPQRCANDWYIDHIAWHSLHRTDQGWQWRFDPLIFADPTGDHRIARFEGELAGARCPTAVVIGAESYLAPGAVEAFAGASEVPLRMIPGAAHHVMLDQPLALLHELQQLLTTWPRSAQLEPGRRQR